MSERVTVAVIGLGPAGLVALKNLIEEGFEATGFDRNRYVGGLWQYSAEGHTSVMETTVVNISKERGCFTDFPYPEDIPSYPTAAQVHEYLASYLKHFELESRIRLATSVKQVTFDESLQKWIVNIEGKSAELFDKIVVAIGGMVGAANIPATEGVEKFTGSSVHSQAFKRPKEYAGRRVMVVGFGNSAADTATQLVDVADEVYLAHRHGARILPRGFNGAPIDHTQSMRLFTIQSLFIDYFPRLGEKLFDKFIKSLQDKSFKIRPEWGFEPVGRIPIVSDNLVRCLEDGSIKSVAGVKRFIGGTQVELDDGSKLDVDAVVWSTGYKSDFSIMDRRFDPTSPSAPSSWSTASGSNNKTLFRLYHNVFSLEKPDSLAFLGNVQFAIGGFLIFDLASMAIAQVWKGASSLPSRLQMDAIVDKHHVWLGDHAQRSNNVSPGTVDGGPWMRAMNDMAGTGVNENLGYGLKGWLFWFKDRPLCNLLMGGIWTPHMYRIFGGKRQVWEGAREAIERVNEIVAANKKRQKEKEA